MTTTSNGSDHLNDLRALVADLPEVIDSAVVDRSGRAVVYVVPARAAVGAQIRAALPTGWQAEVVLVSRLPRTDVGELDLAPLLRLPVLDAQTAARAAAATGDPGAIAEVVPVAGSHLAADAASSQPKAELAGEPLPEIPATLGRLLRSAAESAHVVHLHAGDGGVVRWTYAELLSAALRVCGGLRTAGVRPGERVAIAARELPAFVPAFWGAVLAGAVVVPIGVPDRSPAEAAAEVGRTAAEVSARLLLTDVEGGTAAAADAQAVSIAELLVAAEGEPVERVADDLVLGLLTSGSTGRPKIVGQTHRAVIANAAAASARNRFTAEDVSLNWFPLDHVGGLVMFHVRDVYLGCDQIQVPVGTILRDPLAWLDLIDRYRVTVTWAPNFAYQLVTARVRECPDRKWDLTCLRFLLNGGEAVVAAQSLDFLAALAPFGLPEDCIHPAWGMSETCSGVLYSDRFTPDGISPDARHVSVGFPVPGCAVRIVGENNAVVGHGVPGALVVRGPMVTRGYLGDDTATAAAIDAEGWFHTGDRATAGPDGITVIGRDKDVIICGGRNIAAGEIEAVVDEVPGVDRTWSVAVAVRRAENSTDDLAVVFVPAGNEPADVVAERVRRAVLRQARVRPAYVRSVTREEIPRTAIGKPKRAAVRQALFGPDPEPVPVPAQPPVLAAGLETAAAAPADGRPRRLVLVGRSEWADAIAERLDRRGHTTTVLDPGDDPSANAAARRRLRAALARAASAGEITDLVALVEPLAVSVDEHTRPDGPPAQVERGCRLVPALLHAVDRPDDAEPLDLVVVARDPGDGRGTGVAQAAGVLAADAARELPWLSARLVVASGGDDAASDGVVDEILARDTTAWEVHRAGPARRVRTLTQVAQSTVDGSAVKVGGRYLVTGGLGGVGRHVCAHLLREYGARLLVIGVQEAESGERAVALARLRALGTVTYLPVDVADETALRSAVRAFERDQGAPLDGVFHLAGELTSRKVADLSAADIEDACYAKVRGALAISAMLTDRPDAIEVLFSSVHSLVPAPGIGAYAAANRFLDVLSGDHRAAGSRSWSLAWSRWGVPGMSHGVDGADIAAAGGLLTLSADAGIAALGTVLSNAPGWYTIGLDTTNPRLAYLRGGIHALERVEVRSCQPGALETVTVTDDFGAEVHARVTVDTGPSGGPPRVDVRAVLSEVWCDLLSLDSVSGSDDFFDLGGHSMMLPRMQQVIQERLGIALPAVVIFERPTLDEFTEGVAALAATAG